MNSRANGILQAMHLGYLRLYQFKNYTEAEMEFVSGINCLSGLNGSGKTNVLDAIYYLSFTKSFFQSSDMACVQFGTTEFLIHGRYQSSKDLVDVVQLNVDNESKKKLWVNNNEVKKMALHIGSFPLVMIAPYDVLLILEGNETRRKWIDGILSQTDAVYLTQLLQYNRILEQRNRHLKAHSTGATLDLLLLESYNEQLSQYGTNIYLQRKKFIAGYSPLFETCYQTLSGGIEKPSIAYVSDLDEKPLMQWFELTHDADIASGRTTKGIHRDSIEWLLNSHNLKKTGSQGQQKSYLIALKLAQYEHIRQVKNVKPILLLDDLFEKLDAMRLQTLLTWIAGEQFGQIFITDSHADRMHQAVNSLSTNQKYFKVEKGKISHL